MEREHIDIGGAVTEAVLSGRGEVTVVFVNGLATSLEEWDAVVAALADRARVLRYDRRRPPPTGPVPTHSAADSVADLATLLTAMAVRPPLVVVGHSWGGAIARLFAQRNPEGVAGLVFVDATNEAIDSPGLALLPHIYRLMPAVARVPSVRRRLVDLFCPAAAPSSYRSRVEQMMADPARRALTFRTARAESSGLRASLATLRRDCPDLPRVPTCVLTAPGTGAAAKSSARVRDAWQAMVDRATDAELTTVAESGHHIPLTAPDAVIQAIVRVLKAVETGQPLRVAGRAP